MSAGDAEVAIVGGGVVGCAVAHALARRGAQALLLEAEPGLALGASGANSGILHTGFDSTPGELETKLILRSAELREELVGELGVAVWRAAVPARGGRARCGPAPGRGGRRERRRGAPGAGRLAARTRRGRHRPR